MKPSKYLAYKHLPYPVNLWSSIFETEVPASAVPEDWSSILVFAAEKYGVNKDIKLLEEYFKDDLTCPELGKRYDLTETVIMFNLRKATRKLQALQIRQLLSCDTASDDLSALHLGTRATNCLHRAGIFSTEQILQYTVADLLNTRSLGNGIWSETMACVFKFVCTAPTTNLKPQQAQ